MQLLAKKKDFRKHAAAIHSWSWLSLLDKKISNILLSNAQENLLSQQIHQISIAELIRQADYNSHDIGLIKSAIINLEKTLVKWDLLDVDNSSEWWVTSLLASARIKWWICEYEYSRLLAEKLHNPEIYAIINIQIQKHFKKSVHAFTLHENCLRYKWLLKKYGFAYTDWMTLTVFREIMWVSESEYYAEFKNLNAKVIKPAIKEINRLAEEGVIDFRVEFEKPKRAGRSVSEIRFKITRNPSFKSLWDLESEIEIKLHKLGLSKKVIYEYTKEYSGAYLEEKIAYTKRQAKRGKIKTSISGYLRNAIEHDYVFKKTPEKIIEANENSEEFVSVTERKKQDKKLLEEYFLSLGNDGYKEFVKEFTDHIKEIGNWTERQKIEKNFHSPLFSAKKLDYAKHRAPEFFK